MIYNRKELMSSLFSLANSVQSSKSKTPSSTKTWTDALVSSIAGQNCRCPAKHEARDVVQSMGKRGGRNEGATLQPMSSVTSENKCRRGKVIWGNVHTRRFLAAPSMLSRSTNSARALSMMDLS